MTVARRADLLLWGPANTSVYFLLTQSFHCRTNCSVCLWSQEERGSMSENPKGVAQASCQEFLLRVMLFCYDNRERYARHGCSQRASFPKADKGCDCNSGNISLFLFRRYKQLKFSIEQERIFREPSRYLLAGRALYFCYVYTVIG